MIETLDVLTYERVLGLDENQCPGEWGGKITFEWKDVRYIRTYQLDEATIKNEIYPQECTRIFFSNNELDAYVVKLKYDVAIQRFTNSREK